MIIVGPPSPRGVQNRKLWSKKGGDFRKYQYLGSASGYFNAVFAYFGVGVLDT
jgi:hypothetical protein